MLPSVVMREWARLPVGMLETIIDYRLYAQTKAIRDRTERQQDLPQTPRFQLVQQIEFELAAEDLAKKGT